MGGDAGNNLNNAWNARNMANDAQIANLNNIHNQQNEQLSRPIEMDPNKSSLRTGRGLPWGGTDEQGRSKSMIQNLAPGFDLYQHPKYAQNGPIRGAAGPIQGGQNPQNPQAQALEESLRTSKRSALDPNIEYVSNLQKNPINQSAVRPAVNSVTGGR